MGALGTLLVSALTVLLALMGAAPAHASCARATPPGSPARFTGVVLGTELAQRVAYVHTDDGRNVVVRGTDSTAADAFTTIDRTYLTGHRYDFHPVNDTSPFEDNICTATLDLGPAPTSDPVSSQAAEALVGDAPESDGPSGWALGAAAGAGLLMTGVVLVRRRREAGGVPPSPGDGADL